MPEGDVIHRTAARLEAALGDEEIVQASAPNPRAGLDRAVGGLVGDRVECVEARGKHLLIRFAGGRVVHNHLGMKGRWRVGGHEGARPSSSRGRGPLPWLVLETDDVTAIQTGGSRLRILSDAAIRRDPQLARLGPDVVEKSFDVDRGVRVLRSVHPGERIGTALLDQTLLSGIGNIFRCEACFAAAVSPWCRVSELSDEQVLGVVDEAASLMRASAAGSRPERRVYRRSGKPCPRCGTPVSSRPQGDAARMTYWCPGCQR